MEVDGYTEVCATSTSKGIGEVFTTNVTVDNVASKTIPLSLFKSDYVTLHLQT